MVETFDEDRKRFATILQVEHPAIWKQFEGDVFIEVEIMKKKIEHEMTNSAYKSFKKVLK